MVKRPLIPRLAPVAILLAVIAFYLPAVHFGFFWDDPVLFGHVQVKEWWRLLLPTTDYHFFRPFYLLYNRFFWQADGTFTAVTAHWAQICLHLLNVALSFSIARRVGLGQRAALAVATLVGTYPFSFQAVAWAAPSQPLVATFQGGSWLAYLVARSRFPFDGHRDSAAIPSARSGLFALAISLVLYSFALGTQESSLPLALVPLLLEFALQGAKSGLRESAGFLKDWAARRTFLAFGHPVLAVGFLLLWLNSPRYEGVVGLVLDGRVTSYLSQGFVYPLVGRPRGYPPDFGVTDAQLLGFSMAALGLVVALAARKGRLLPAMVGVAWAWLSVLPAQVGLSYSYASLAPRLLYSAAPAISLAWVSALWPTRERGIVSRQGIGAALLLAIIVQSGWLLSEFRHFYRVGIEHLAQAVHAQANEPGPHLFVNFPDRYEPVRAPYPLGDWGLPLAPVSVDLADFSRMLNGGAPETLSRALPWIDTEARENGPFRVALRGIIIPADQLYRLAASGYRVYLSRYLPDAEMFLLQVAGSVESERAGRCQTARFGNVLCLQSVNIREAEGVLQLHTAWSIDGDLEPNVTIFAHLGSTGQPPLAQADGDAWRGLLPLTLWQVGDLIHDYRTIARPSGRSDDVSLQIGIYDRLTGDRLTAVTVDNVALPDNAFVMPLTP